MAFTLLLLDKWINESADYNNYSAIIHKYAICTNHMLVGLLSYQSQIGGSKGLESS